MRITEEHLKFISETYDTVLDHETWTSQLGKLATMAGVGAVNILRVDPANSVLQITQRSYSLNKDAHKEFSKDFAADEAKVLGGIGKFAPHALIAEQDLCQSIEDYSNSRAPASAWKADVFGLGNRYFANLGKRDGYNDLVTFYSDQGSKVDPVFIQELVKIFAPHLVRALRLAEPLSQLESSVKSSLNALNRLSVGAVLVTKKGQILFTNDEAERILSLEDGIKRDRQQCLCIQNAGIQSVFLSLLAGCEETIAANGIASGGAIFIERHSGGDAFILEVSPACGQTKDLSHSEGTLLFLTDPACRRGISCNNLEGLYGLTKAEIEISSLLAEGYNTEEISEIRKVSIATTRTQIKSIFLKTGTQKRSDLMRLILRVSVPKAL
ncbi:helix-turn-helix transcriptional regulator [Kiloniella sp. EL199]|uniref:helix-turn-helix transcriptional regulator n=1 Tax=Kiloniella sp. EL199 TaxID=2107581 RepID=UPI000EA27A73|nr:helix-turn-helix transcriptional regulator [Kiloniella sp. EL199]